MKKLSVCLLVLSVTGCSQYEPVASPVFDGRYVGSRQSNDSELCGVDKLKGTTSAQVRGGNLNMLLFGPGTELAGTVGAGGRVRASGIWRPPHAHYPQVTVLHGLISGDVLEGTASDFRCSTDVQLRKVVVQPHPAPPRQPESKRRPSSHKPPQHHHNPTHKVRDLSS